MSADVKASRRLKSKYKRLLTELEYLYSKLDYVTEEHAHRKEEFQEDFLEFCEEHGYDCTSQKTRDTYQKKQVDPYIVDLNDADFAEIEDELQEDLEHSGDGTKDLKNLYRKIATQTHPDKLLKEKQESAKERKKRLFLEAKEALEQNNFFKMAQIAKELDVELPEPTHQHLVWMRQEKTKIEKTISGVKETFEWAYGEDSPQIPKVNLFYRYAKIIGCVKLEKEIHV
jgi:leucyl aminopeptidase